jgi:hypothetical protein
MKDAIWRPSARPAIPTKGNEGVLACPAGIDDNHNIAERLWARLREWRAVATRYTISN